MLKKVFSTRSISITGFDYVEGPVTLGFRAEDANISSNKKVELIGPVYSMELLGESTMVTVKSNNSLISVKADKDYRMEIGKEVKGAMQKENSHWFNASKGERNRH